jgi:hypothetical protein
LVGEKRYRKSTSYCRVRRYLLRFTEISSVHSDLVGIRFRAKYGEYVFDDIMKSEQPYYLRIGSHNVIQGIEEVLPMLNVGDVAHVVVPGEAAFGSKGRKASPGKRAIPPNATIEVKYSVLSDTFHRLK